MTRDSKGSPVAGAGPLAGRRILVTRRPEQASALVSGLRGLGAEVVELPAIDVAPPEDPVPLDEALRHLDRYNWLLFTSANAVRFVAARLEALGLDAELSRGRTRVGSVGPSTTEAFEARFGARVHLQPESDFRAEGLIEALAGTGLAGARVLLPVSDRAREALPQGLGSRGAQVDVVVAYRTVAVPGLDERLRGELCEGIDLATFASPSAVESFAAAAGERARGVPAAVIGPITERSARRAGLDVRVAASPSTVEGLLAGILRYFGARRPGGSLTGPA